MTTWSKIALEDLTMLLICLVFMLVNGPGNTRASGGPEAVNIDETAVPLDNILSHAVSMHSIQQLFDISTEPFPHHHQ